MEKNGVVLVGGADTILSWNELFFNLKHVRLNRVSYMISEFLDRFKK